MAKQKKRSKAMRLVRIVLFQKTFQIWNTNDNRQAVPGFRTNVRTTAIREAKKHGLKPELYGGAKKTLRVA